MRLRRLRTASESAIKSLPFDRDRKISKDLAQSRHVAREPHACAESGGCVMSGLPEKTLEIHVGIADHDITICLAAVVACGCVSRRQHRDCTFGVRGLARC